MNRRISQQKWLLIALCVALVLTLSPGRAGFAEGTGHPEPATPFQDVGGGSLIVAAESVAVSGDIIRTVPPMTVATIGSDPDIAEAAEWLVAQQKTSGCFPWTKGDSTCPSNVQGPAAHGLLKGYQLTGDDDYLDAAVAAGDYYLTPPYPAHYTDGDARFATHDPLFLEDLSQVSGDPDYAAFVQTYFWDKLTAGTYGESNNMDAADFGAVVVAGRSGQGIVELSPWDLAGTAIAAHVAGETAIRDALMGAIVDGLEATTIPATYDVIGLAGGVWAAAVTGVELNPEAGSYSSDENTADLADRLAGWQRSSDGAWLWGTAADPGDVTDGDTQNTAFAIMGLHALPGTTYDDAIARGGAFIRSVQASDGQILVYPTASATYNGGVETHSEAMQALVAAAPMPPSVWIKYSGNPVVTGSAALDPYVLKDGATYKMWYTHIDAGGNWTIYYATSLNGTAWTVVGQVLAPSGVVGTYDEVRVGGPSVVKDGDTDYKMWFSARDATAKWSVGYATSTDGVVWSKFGTTPVLDVGAPGAWDSQMAREPWVINDGGTYKMWYAGTASWPVFKIGYATSTNGSTWLKSGSNPIFTGTPGGWDGFQVYGPSVVLDSGTYHMYFSGTDNSMSQRWSTGHATSADGITSWVEDIRNPVLIPDTGDSADYVSAMNDGGIWKIWFSYPAPPSYEYAIGLATLTGDTELWLDPAVASLTNDGATTKTFDINLANAVDLYGYQLVTTFNATNLVATAAAFDNGLTSFFYTPQGAPTGWNADIDNINGKVAFARTRENPQLPVSGSGRLATVTFACKLGAAAGAYKIEFAQNILSDIDGTSLTHSTQYAWLTCYGAGTLQGSVDLQGRTNESGATVTIMTAGGYTASTTTNSAGAWSFTGIPTGSYQVNIEMPRYLDAQKGSSGGGVSVTAGGTTTLAKVKLLGGDADDTLPGPSDYVDISDASIIGGQFGLTPVTPANQRADINNDTIVDILDLTLMGGNWHKSSPVFWL